MHQRGFGFVKPQKNSFVEEDIFIPVGKSQGAVHGDTVEVEVSETISSKGPEGEVIGVLERGKSHLGGMITEVYAGSHSVAKLPLMGDKRQVLIDTGSQKVRPGDRVVVEMTSWGDNGDELTARLCHIIGHISDASADIPAAIEEYGLRKDFPLDVQEEAESFGKTLPSSSFKGRLDLRELVCVTIDPDTAKDFDDAISIEKIGTQFRLGVHIADVTHYVKPGSALDEEAFLRANSTYFPGVCIPMLPAALSNNLCSLKAQRNRLAVTVFIHISPSGEVENYSINRSVIRSKKRFTYKQARAVMEGKVESPYKNLLHNMEELALILKEKRTARGSLDLSLSETILRLNEKGEPTGLEIEEYDITHQMIEEFMLKANEVIALDLFKKGNPIAYRVHDSPNDDSITDYIRLLHQFGIEVSEQASPFELNTAIKNATQTAYGQYLAGQYIRKMKLAYYSPENTGHWGLSLSHYCHFTSPIRRYADLLVHRVLLEKEIPLAKVEEITEQCSEKERLSSMAEISVLRLKKLRLLQKWFNDSPQNSYEAVVTSLKPSGIIVEVLQIGVEAFIHISELGDDYFVYNDINEMIIGSHSDLEFAKGQIVSVMITEVDLVEGKCFFTVLEGGEIPKKTSSKQRFKGKNENFRRKKKKKSSEKKNKKRIHR